MNRITSPAASSISFSTAFRRSSNSPRYLAPASSDADVERDHALAGEALGDVAGDDPLGEALDDGRLARARLADQDRVVLGAPREHLDDAADLLVAADHRVELAALGGLGEVAARTARAPGTCPRGSGRSPGPSRARPAGRASSPSRVTPLDVQRLARRRPRLLQQGQQQVLGGDVLVVERLGLLAGAAQHARGRRSRAGRRWSTPLTWGRRAMAASVAARSAGEVGAGALAARARRRPRGRRAARAAGARARSTGLPRSLGDRGPSRRSPPGRARWACPRPSDASSSSSIVTLVDHAAVARHQAVRCRAGDGTSCPRAGARLRQLRRGGRRPSPRRARRARSRARRSARSSRCSSSSTRSMPARLRPSSESSWMRRSSSHVGLGVDPRVARRALRGDEAAALVHAQGLGVHARQLGGDADQEEAGGAAGAHENSVSRGFARVELGELLQRLALVGRELARARRTRSVRDQVAAPVALQARRALAGDAQQAAVRAARPAPSA